MLNRFVVYSKYLNTKIRILLYSLFNPGRLIKVDLKCVMPHTVNIEVDRRGELRIGKHTSCRSGCKINVRSDAILEIGDGVSINYNCIIATRKNIKIGSGTIIGPNTCIYDHDHVFSASTSIHENIYSCENVTIGENVWIGANCIILKGTSIGSDSVIAAGSIVKGDVPCKTLLLQKRNTELRKI